ncbi:MAG TPA: hypothetical protein VD886_19715 [Herpetosiphonaceae bacterium]|nr:hypothetical protein [Herpetosiphonaceae bacterium]
MLFNLLPVVAPPETPLPQDLIDMLWQSIRGAFRSLAHPQLVGALVRYPPHARRQELYGELADALLERDDEFILAAGLSRLVPHLPFERQGAILERIGAMRLEHTAPRTLIDLSAVVAPALRTRAIELARAFAARSRSRSTVDLLVKLAQLVSPDEQPGVYQEALQLAQTIQDRDAYLMALLSLAPFVSPARRSRLYARLRELPAVLRSARHANEALDLTARLPEKARRLAERAVLEAGTADPEILAGSLGRLTGRTRATAEAILMEHLADVPQDGHAADRARQQLIAVFPLFPRRLLGAAELAARHHQDDHQRALILAVLAQRSQGRHQRALYAEALASIRAHPKPYAGFDMLGYLPAEPAAGLAHAILQDMLAGERQPNPRLFSRLAPHLSPAGITALVRRAADSPYAEERVDAWLELAPFTPVDQQADVYRAIFAHVPAIRAMGAYARLLTRLIPNLPADLLPQALEAARAIAGKPTPEDRSPGAAANEHDQRYDLLGEALLAILVRLPVAEQPALAEECIRAAQRTASSHRARALLRLLPHLAPERQAAAALEILAATYEPTRYIWGRSQVFGKVAPWLIRAGSMGMLAPDELRAHWQRAIRGFAQTGRAELLEILVAGAPWLATLASKSDLDAISGSVIAIAECWP